MGSHREGPRALPDTCHAEARTDVARRRAARREEEPWARNITVGAASASAGIVPPSAQRLCAMPRRCSEQDGCNPLNHIGQTALYLLAACLLVVLMTGCAMHKTVKRAPKLDGGCLMQGGVTYPCPPMA